MKAKHTPGPWKVRAKDSGYSIIGRGVSVARIERTSATGPEQTANATLIVASPDLLTAAHKALVFLGANYSDSDMPDILPALRAAVAKATAGAP